MRFITIGGRSYKNVNVGSYVFVERAVLSPIICENRRHPFDTDPSVQVLRCPQSCSGSPKMV